jgi:serine/threonine-protein kinase
MIGAGDTVKILDFGLARLTEGTHLTAERAVLGTLAYMSPEQLRGDEVGFATDIWSFGVILFEMLTGKTPFEGRAAAAISDQIEHGPLPSVTHLRRDTPSAFVSMIEECLCKDPHDRPKSTTSLIDRLERIQPGTQGETRSPSVAVLPFLNMSPDPNYDFFGDGLAEELINALAQIEGLKVAARTSTFRFGGRDVDIREVGHALDVGTVLEGSVRTAGDRLRVTAQLIDVSNGYHLWSERYDRKIEDVFAIQDEITLGIVENLEATLSLRAKPAAKVATPDLDAYSAFLQGRYHWHSLTAEGWVKSREYFERAIEFDPDFALAHAWISIWYQSQAFWGDVPPGDAFSKSRQAALKALELDESISEAHNSLAVIHFSHDWDMEASEREFLRALELDPHSALLRVNRAVFLSVSGRHEEAAQEADLAEKLDPLSSLVLTWSALILTYVDEYDAAIEKFKRVVEMDPDYWQPRAQLGVALMFASRIEEAITELTAAVRLSGGATVAVMELCRAHLLAGNHEQSEELFHQLCERGEQRYVSPQFMVWLHTLRGEIDEAYQCLERAIEDRDPWLCWYRTGPRRLRSDEPRFEALLDRAGVPRD